MFRPSVCALVWSACLGAPSATAQSAPDPLDPKAPVRATRYESPLARPLKADDAAPLPWRDANTRVERIGGWRAYAREAASPAPPASAPAARQGPQR